MGVRGKGDELQPFPTLARWEICLASHIKGMWTLEPLGLKSGPLCVHTPALRLKQWVEQRPGLGHPSQMALLFSRLYFLAEGP